MAQHRGFTRQKFVYAVGPDLMHEYLAPRVQIDGTNGEVTAEILDGILEAQPPEVRKVIDEELQCINDVADKGMDYLDRACTEYGESFEAESPRERVSMQLFLSCHGAFRMACDLYLYRTATNSMSHHQLTGGSASFVGDKIEEFRDTVEQWFGGETGELKKGKLCEVRYYKDDDAHVLIVGRGDYMHTQTEWENGSVKTRVYRPAKEDVLRFSPDNSILSLKMSGSGNAQRRFYVDTFGKRILGLDIVPETALESTTVSLEPIRTGNFDYCHWGKGSIEWIQLVEVNVKFPDIKARVVLASPDILQTVHDDLKDLRFTNAELQSAKLHFKLDYDGAPSKPIPVLVKPPQRTVFNRKRDGDIIETHLRENGVLLV